MESLLLNSQRQHFLSKLLWARSLNCGAAAQTVCPHSGGLCSWLTSHVGKKITAEECWEVPFRIQERAKSGDNVLEREGFTLPVQ